MSSKPKVICLGLGRTGTTSLMIALEELGFGPCHHMRVLLQNENLDEMNMWCNLGQGLATLDDLRTVLDKYNSSLDYPSAIYYDKLYEAYPDAKFILTTRDPAEWEVSIKATILPATETFKSISDTTPFASARSRWFSEEMLSRYHQNKLETDTQGEIIAHNQRVMQTIPADKLLVYEITEGWDPLVKFLGVEKPEKPFPHVNITTDFQNGMKKYRT